MSSDVVDLTIDAGVAVVTLERPERLNAINGAVLDGLRSSCRRIEEDRTVRAVVLQGSGRAFCAGADLGYVQPLVADSAAFGRFLDEWNEVFDRIERLPVPVIAAVHGVVLAGGFELTHVCDLMILADDAVIGDGHARYGMFPAGGGIHRLDRLIGPRRARWLLMSGETIAPRLAMEWGLAHEVVPADRVQPRALEIAHSLSARSSALSAAIKSGLLEHRHESVGRAMAAERSVATDYMTSDEVRIGLAAFRDRTEPVFAPRPAPGFR